MSQTTNKMSVEPVRKTLTVKRAPAGAFRLFTQEMGKWWPLASHSVGGADAETVVFEEMAGGQIFERHRNGKTADWGAVRLWDPPHRVVFSWHPGRGSDTAQEIEVRFTASGSGTSVELEHRGWEAAGEDAAKIRDNYDQGWDFVFTEKYGKAAGGSSL